MYRYVFLLFTATLLRATPFTTVTCTLGTQAITSSTSCFIPYVVGGTGSAVEASAKASDTIGGVGAEVAVGLDQAVDPGLPWSAGGTASDTAYYTTPGPKRQGLISVLTSGMGGATLASVGGISQNGTFPFELGTVFQATSYASVTVGSSGGSFASDTFSGVSFQLFEADGVTPVTANYAAVLEPRSGALLLAGLGVSALVRRRQLRT